MMILQKKALDEKKRSRCRLRGKRGGVRRKRKKIEVYENPWIGENGWSAVRQRSLLGMIIVYWAIVSGF